MNGGREGRPIGAYELAKAVEELGAGEILLNCIDCDGMHGSCCLVYIIGVTGRKSEVYELSKTFYILKPPGLMLKYVVEFVKESF